MTLSAHDDYTRFCDGIRSLTGIDLGQYKRQQMERRIRSLAERRGFELPAYSEKLAKDPALLDEFLDRVTINVSQLWRNPEQWQQLQRTLAPELAQSGRIRAWSAGSSYGAEAYTIAAICRTATGVPVAVNGTDIDRRMIDRARRGWFSADDARTVPADMLRRWFTAADGGWQASRELLHGVTFEICDLLRTKPPAGRYDLVVCRNVVIYFTQPVRDELHARLASALRPGGYLMVGSSERITDPRSMGLEGASPFIYRKV